MSGLRVTGVDLSLSATGLCTAEVGTPGAPWVTVRTLDPRRLTDLERLRWIRELVVEACVESDLAVVEGLAFASQSGKAAERGGLWWLVRDALDAHGVPVAVMTPAARAVYATGSGRANKQQVLAAVVRRYPDVPVSDDNQADALALAGAGLDHHGCPLVVVPQSHRRALDKVQWPTTQETA